MADWAREVRLGIRSLGRDATLAVIAIATTGIAIGATTAVYGAVDWLLNRSPPGVAEPERLVTLRTSDGASELAFAFTQFTALKLVQDAFVDLAAFGKMPGVHAGETASDQVIFQFVTGNYFGMLGVEPALGRAILPEDDIAGGPSRVMLSYAFWQRRFGRDPGVVGRTIVLNGQGSEVIGVLPRQFEGYSLDWNGPTDVWAPMQSFTQLFKTDRLSRVGQTGILFPLIGRLRPGVSVDEAAQRAQTWVGHLTTAPADRYKPTKIVLKTGPESRIAAWRQTRSLFNILLAVSGVILLAAGFNVANFLVGRTASRRREIAVRAALGASRARICRLLLIEALVIGMSATVVGGIVAVGLLEALAAGPRLFLRVPLATDSAIDLRLAGVATWIGLASALLFGLVPALMVSLRNPLENLRRAQAQWSWSRLRLSVRQLILVGQVALAVVLTSTAALYAHSALKIARIPVDFDEPERVLLARLTLHGMTVAQTSSFYTQLLPGMNAVPGVQSASIGWNPPFAIGRATVRLPHADATPLDVGATAVAPGFYRTLGVPVVSGREFDGSPADAANGLIINENLARRLWPNESPVGKAVIWGDDTRTVTGVVAESRCGNLLGPPEPCAHRPFPNSQAGTLRIRTTGDPLAVVPALRAYLRQLSPNAALADAKPLDVAVRDVTAAERLSASATLALAVLGVCLLAVGCASLFVAMVRDSRREIAVRMALGVSRSRLAARILVQGAVLLLVGAGIGLFAARATAVRIADSLFEVGVSDPLAFIGAPGFVAVVCLASVSLAVVLALRTNPATILRGE